MSGGMSIGAGLGLDSLTGGGGPTPIPWRARGHCVSRAFAPVEGVSANGSASTMLYEQNRFYMPVDATNLSLVYHNIRPDADGYQAYTIKASAFTGIGTDESAYQASLPGYEVALWTGGSDTNRRSPSIAVGDYLESDQMALDATAGQLLMVRNAATWSSAPTGFPGSGITKYFGDEVKEVQASYTERINAPIDWAGGYYSIDVTATAWLAPSLVLGTTATRKARVAVPRDSYGNGSGDSDAGNAKFTGWPQKLLNDDYPWYFFGAGGWSLHSLMTTSGNLTRFMELIDLGGFTHVILQLITNDLASGRTAAQFMAQAAEFKTALELLPLKPRLIMTSPPPRTNADNSAVGADYAERKLADSAIRAANGVGYGFIDQSVLFAGGDINISGLWITGGTSDGIHADKIRHEAVVTANSPNLPTILSVAHYG